MEYYDKNFRLGVLGGGQLGRMLIQEAINYDVKIAALDPSAEAPCSRIAHDFVQGDFADYQTVMDFGRDKQVITVEIEHVNVQALKDLRDSGVKVFPQPEVLEIIKDKGKQKLFYQENGIPSADFFLVDDKAGMAELAHEMPFMQKARTGGYDGKGVTPVRNEEEMNQGFDCPSVLEKFVDFEKELSVIVARNEKGEMETFPLVELDFNPEANLVEFLFAPARVGVEIEEKARAIALKTAEAFGVVGILAVELFLTREGEVLVNEVAPRPHNSGHQTIEGNYTSQYGQHLRAITGMPLGDTSARGASVMVNLLGEKGFQGPVKYEGLNDVTAWKGVYVHLYGKTQTKSFRKMGHVTIVSDTLEEAQKTAHQVKDTLKVVAE
ncbi:5-(carboxyamino)imidazole ribonucleotide synthase [bacterium SCSIO 12741]|nr:5-(carboxyamino)imidazole ribonucleotide synthase [bacterium SCSIO 12741]